MTTTYSDNFDHAKPFSDTCSRMALATGVVQTYTVPGTNSQKYRAIISYICTANVFVGYNATPTTPGAGLIVNTGNIEFRPDVRFVKGGDVLSFLTPDANAYVGLSLLALPG
jgi:hypothetical protein